MRDFKGIHFSKTRVTLDDTEFTDCEIINCEIVYSGGLFGWTNTKMTNCQIVLGGPAALTVSFLEKFDLVDVSQPSWKAVVLELPPSEESVH